MPKKLYEQNGNILYILNVLKKYTDIDHILSSKKISEKILKDYNFYINPTTIRRNIRLLKDKFNYDISMFEDNNRGYYLIRDPDTEFELSELEAIIEIFAYSNFITEDISKSIINKCLLQMNIYEQEKYKDYKPAIKDTKTNNKEILNNIEIIKDAILKKKKISFDYYKNDIDEDNKLIEVKVEPKLPYIVSPYLLSFNLQKLYLYGLKDKEKDLHAYRLDRIKNIEILNTKVSNKYT